MSSKKAPREELLSETEKWEKKFDFKAPDELKARIAEIFTEEGVTVASLHKLPEPQWTHALELLDNLEGLTKINKLFLEKILQSIVARESDGELHRPLAASVRRAC